MLEALLFGLITASALVIGSLLGLRFQVPQRVLAVFLAFASGSLISALAFELFRGAVERGGAWRAAVGLIIGAVVFVMVDAWLDRRVAGSGSDAPLKIVTGGEEGEGDERIRSSRSLCN